MARIRKGSDVSYVFGGTLKLTQLQLPIMQSLAQLASLSINNLLVCMQVALKCSCPLVNRLIFFASK